MLHRTKCLLLPTLLAAVMAATLTASSVAADGNDQLPPATNTEDLYYDFDVYLAEDVTIWAVVIEFDDGTVLTFEFESEEEAQMSYDWALNSFSDFIVDIDIVSLTYRGPWNYVATYDRRADAEQLAALAMTYGLYAKVERVEAFPDHALRSR